MNHTRNPDLHSYYFRVNLQTVCVQSLDFCSQTNNGQLILYNNNLTLELLKTESDRANQVQSMNMEDSLIRSVQSSTRTLIESFRDKTKLLANCSDLKLLLREGYKTDIAKQAAKKFFGNNKVSFVAIDGTESQDEHRSCVQTPAIRQRLPSTTLYHH